MNKQKVHSQLRAPEKTQAPQVKQNLLERLLAFIYVCCFRLVNLFIPWDKLPTGLLGALNLEALRIELREHNLFDSYECPDKQYSGHDDAMEERFRCARNSDGKFNDLEKPLMGSACMRFGRNFSKKAWKKPTEEELWSPNPRLVSERFMKRREDEFKPATTLNLLAAAWIQFSTHDWFNHERNDDDCFDIPLPQGDSWPEGEMKLPKTRPDKNRDSCDVDHPGYRNTNTGWWDGSQIYGSSEEATKVLRGKEKDGKLYLEHAGTDGGAVLPPDTENIGNFPGGPGTGFNDNWWVGMEMLHTLFALEHNSICDMLRTKCPHWKGEEIFDKARLINTALMAKIHTVEWTPAILAHPALQIGMDANWWGLAGEKLTKLFGRVHIPGVTGVLDEALGGIPGSGVDHGAAPYSMTEEFVSVYRMHSLLPDNVAFFEAANGRWRETIPIEKMTFTEARRPLYAGMNFSDLFYSFGINYPGAITNNNYPNFLRHLTTPEGIVRDMGTVDILRDRERGVPRYCQFRRMLRMRAPKTFEELTGGDRRLAKALSEVYEGDIEKVDTLVGSHSEPLPGGFGFSETAFRVFILMASRRLKSDRFIAGQWNEDTYTPEGLAYVQNTTMKTVLERHFPHLRPVLEQSDNVFAPWKKLPESVKYVGIETNAPV